MTNRKYNRKNSSNKKYGFTVAVLSNGTIIIEPFGKDINIEKLLRLSNTVKDAVLLKKMAPRTSTWPVIGYE